MNGNNVEIIRLILDAIKEKFVKGQQTLYRHVSAKDTEGDTPFMWAAEGGKVEAAEILLIYGDDVNVQNKNGLTALDWAIQKDHLDVAVVLLKHEDITIKSLNVNQSKKLTNYLIKHYSDETAAVLVTKLLSSSQLDTQIQSYKK